MGLAADRAARAEFLELSLPDASARARAYLATPATGSGRGVLVFDAAPGAGEWSREASDRLAREGFVALAPELPEHAAAELDATAEAGGASSPAAALVAASLSALDAASEVTGSRFAAFGSEIGGSLALFAACCSPRIAAVVDLDGELPRVARELAGSRAALFACFAARGRAGSGDPAEALRRACARSGLRASIASEPAARPGFLDSGRPGVFDAVAAARVWSQALAFLRAELA
jgi:carboxymethylenebutenolidase